MKVIAIGPMYNEGSRVVKVIQSFPKGIVHEIVIVDDASTDGAAGRIAEAGVTVLTHPRRSGPGTAIRTGIDYGLKKDFDAFVIFATNGKDNPQEIPRLLGPLEENRADFVQGSRYLKGGEWRHMPFHRIWGIPAFTFLFSLAVGKRITDGTNGFRAFRRNLLLDSRINLWQKWLEGYPLETYLFFRVIQVGYRVVEVPVTKVYPHSKVGYTKQKAWRDWWNYFKPVPLLALKLRK